MKKVEFQQLILELGLEEKRKDNGYTIGDLSFSFNRGALEVTGNIPIKARELYEKSVLRNCIGVIYDDLEDNTYLCDKNRQNYKKLSFMNENDFIVFLAEILNNYKVSVFLDQEFMKVDDFDVLWENLNKILISKIKEKNGENWFCNDKSLKSFFCSLVDKVTMDPTDSQLIDPSRAEIRSLIDTFDKNIDACLDEDNLYNMNVDCCKNNQYKFFMIDKVLKGKFSLIRDNNILVNSFTGHDVQGKKIEVRHIMEGEVNSVLKEELSICVNDERSVTYNLISNLCKVDNKNETNNMDSDLLEFIKSNMKKAILLSTSMLTSNKEKVLIKKK